MYTFLCKQPAFDLRKNVMGHRELTLLNGQLQMEIKWEIKTHLFCSCISHSYTAVSSVVTQRSSPALRDDRENGRVGDSSASSAEQSEMEVVLPCKNEVGLGASPPPTLVLRPKLGRRGKKKHFRGRPPPSYLKIKGSAQVFIRIVRYPDTDQIKGKGTALRMPSSEIINLRKYLD